MAIVANMIGDLVAFQIAGHSLWQRGETGVISESPVVVPVESQAIALALKDPAETDNATRLLSWIYEFRDFRAITSFLRQNSRLLPLLLEVYGQVRLRFGSDSRLALERFTDPEADSDHGLVVIIGVNLTPEQAQKAMDDFDMEWWLDALPRAEHRLTIVVEYI
jgi:hypothetical protein